MNLNVPLVDKIGRGQGDVKVEEEGEVRRVHGHNVT